MLETGGLKCKISSGPRLTASLTDRGATCRAGIGSVHHGARGPRPWSTVDRLRNPEGVCNLGCWKQIVRIWMKGGRALAWAEADHGGAIAANEVSSSELTRISFPATPNKNKANTMTSATRQTR